jgi:hypothetical protein
LALPHAAAGGLDLGEAALGHLIGDRRHGLGEQAAAAALGVGLALGEQPM